MAAARAGLPERVGAAVLGQPAVCGPAGVFPAPAAVERRALRRGRFRRGGADGPGVLRAVWVVFAGGAEEIKTPSSRRCVWGERGSNPHAVTSDRF